MYCMYSMREVHAVAYESPNESGSAQPHTCTRIVADTQMPTRVDIIGRLVQEQ